MSTEGPLETGTAALSAPEMPGPPEILRVADVTLRFPGAPRPRFSTSASGFRRENSSRSSGRAGAARARCSTLSAGLIKPTRGEVRFKGKRVQDVNTDAAYVTQAANLLPWLTVKGNIGLGLKFQRHARKRNGRTGSPTGSTWWD